MDSLDICLLHFGNKIGLNLYVCGGAGFKSEARDGGWILVGLIAQ